MWLLWVQNRQQQMREGVGLGLVIPYKGSGQPPWDLTTFQDLQDKTNNIVQKKKKINIKPELQFVCSLGL